MLKHHCGEQTVLLHILMKSGIKLAIDEQKGLFTLNGYKEKTI